MENWEYFINGHPYGKMLSVKHLIAEQEVLNEESNPLLKAAIIHAQFESIHPFLDGNGRLGRIIIVLYLIQAEIIAKPIFFVSEELERERMRYYNLLNGVRGTPPDWASWILFFLNACDRMALNSLTEKELIFTDHYTKRNKKYKNYDLLQILN